MRNLIAFLAVALILTASAVAQRPGGGRGPSAEQRKKMLKKYDLNGDGKLDAEERKKARADRGGRGRGRGRGRGPRNGDKPGGETDKPRGETDKPRGRRPRGGKPGEGRGPRVGDKQPGSKPDNGKGRDKRPAEHGTSGINL